MAIDSDKLDRSISGFMNRHGVQALQISLAVIFIWFGLLKTFGISPAAELVKSTVNWLPVFNSDEWVLIIGWWEVIIGVCFLFKKTIRIAIALLAMQMAGTFMPLVLLPEITFQAGKIPYAPTIEGQYIIKNLLIISAALVIGGTLRSKESKFL
ncbi:MAG TPA: hypothetical protein PK536_06235 [Ignavibacteria bacterium]|nr:hypothetical protein [Bacteroidota bacterium]HRI85030.1 hypothetical protein [Ignavibacteria bacterium]HRJ98646.1 hypothetical protein [Ignavibacteria bacterium]